MTPLLSTIILIIAIIIYVGSLIISHHAAVQLGKSEGYLTSISKYLAAHFAALSVPLHEEVKKEEKLETAQETTEIVKETTENDTPKEPIKKKYRFTSTEENLKNAKYSGVIHKFVRNGKTKERPVMVYEYRGEQKFFEYDEVGHPVRLSGKEKEYVLAAKEGRKIRNFKKYDINIQES